jgi:hypothetical protein
MPTSVEASFAPARSGWLASLAASLRENAPLMLVIGLYLVAADTLSALVGMPYRSFDHLAVTYRGFIAFCAACLAAAFVLWILHVTLVRKISIQSRQAWRLVGTEFLSRDRILLALPILALWPVLARAFSLVKALIPAVQPFYLDPFFHWLDRALHFGYDPWTLLQPLLGFPIVTYVINLLNALWFVVIYVAIVQQIATLRDRRLRLQFLLSSVLAWTLLGGLAATLLSSAGPCYYALVVGTPDPFAAQITYLRETVQNTRLSLFGYEHKLDLIAVSAQDLLWSSYQAGDFGLGRGISAAPSMHVASTWLLARLAQTYGRRAAIAGWSFFAVILVGSVHLAWHYAVDGYLAIAGAWVLWRLTGWWLDHPAVKGFLWPQAVRAA